MMTGEQKGNLLLWIVTPEDSSNRDPERMGFCSCAQNGKEFFCSITKFIVWYGAALLISLFLAGLH